MRLKLSRFRRNFNKDLPIEFTEQNLSSFGGLELFSRYLRRLELSRRVREALRGKGIRSDSVALDWFWLWLGCCSLELVV